MGCGYFYGVVWWLWWVSSALFSSSVGLMQDVMKSFPSFLTYCCYYLYLFTVKYCFCVKASALIWRENWCTGGYLEVIIE